MTANNGDGVVVDVEHLIGNPDVDIMGEVATRDAVTIGDDGVGTRAVSELEPHVVGDIVVDKVVGRAGVQQNYELLIAHGDVKLHRVLSTMPAMAAKEIMGVSGSNGAAGIVSTVSLA